MLRSLQSSPINQWRYSTCFLARSEQPYTRDFDVERLWRDNRLNPIHTGTTGIQGIDLLGRKLL